MNLSIENYLNEKKVLDCATRGRQSSINLPENVKNATRKVCLCKVLQLPEIFYTNVWLSFLQGPWGQYSLLKN